MNTPRKSNHRSEKACRYPNIAESRYFWNRIAETVLCTASTVGVVTVFFFLIALS